MSTAPKSLLQAQFDASVQHLRTLGVACDNASIEAWHTAMTTPLDPSRIKYTKALERMLQRVPVLYYGAHYADGACFDDAKLLGGLSSSTGEDVWTVIGECNRICARYHEYELPALPTKDEIQANIESRRGQRKKTGGMEGEFCKSLADLYKEASAAMAEDVSCRGDLYSRWKAHLSERIGNATFAEACAARDAAALSKPEAWDVHGPLAQHIAGASESFWDVLDAINSVCALANAMPESLLHAVEQQAEAYGRNAKGGAANDMAEMLRVGENILANMSQEDMTQLTNSIPTLLPALTQQLKKSPELAGIVGEDALLQLP